MATSLTSIVRASINWDYQNENSLGNIQAQSSSSYQANLANGTSANQADKIYFATGTISASSTLTLDLSGVLTDVFGATITFARVKAIFVEVTDDTAGGPVEVEGNFFFRESGEAPIIVSAAGTAELRVKNGGCFLLSAPDATAYTVTNSTADELELTNESGSTAATYIVVVIGATA